jgi:hypothetical protein
MVCGINIRLFDNAIITLNLNLDQSCKDVSSFKKFKMIRHIKPEDGNIPHPL